MHNFLHTEPGKLPGLTIRDGRVSVLRTLIAAETDA